jgi:hypothetical protein
MLRQIRTYSRTQLLVLLDRLRLFSLLGQGKVHLYFDLIKKKELEENPSVQQASLG